MSNEPKPIKFGKMRAENVSGAGWRLTVEIDQVVPCVEFGMAKGEQTIIQSLQPINCPLPVAVERWVQFAPEAWNEMMADIMPMIADAFNEKLERQQGSEGVELERFGLKWTGPEDFVAKPMPDGYWTPWHIAHMSLVRALARIAEVEAQLERLCTCPTKMTRVDTGEVLHLSTCPLHRERQQGSEGNSDG